MTESTAERITHFFTPSFIKHFPDTARLAPLVYLVPTWLPHIHAFIHNEYPRLIVSLRAGTITCADILLVHKLVFFSQLPDQVYQVVDRLKPELLEMHRSLTKEMQLPRPEGSLHLLHALDLRGQMRPAQGRRRKVEYAATPASVPTQQAATKHVVVHAPQGLAEWVLGEPTSPHVDGDASPGLYHTTRAVLPNLPPPDMYSVTYYAAYLYYRRTVPARMAKRLASIHHKGRQAEPGMPKLGLRSDGTYYNATKHRSRTYGQQAAEKKRGPPAGSAIPVSFRDENFSIRMRRLEVLDELRRLDAEIIRQHLGSPRTQTRISYLLIQFRTALATHDIDLLHSVILTLYPDVDAELTARTRIKPELLAIMLSLPEVDPHHEVLAELAQHTGGLGYASFAGLCQAVLLSPGSRTLIPALAVQGWFARGSLPAAKICKEFHNYSRRLQTLPQCVAELPSLDGRLLRDCPEIKLDNMLYIGNLLGRGQDTLTADDGDDVERTNAVADHILIEGDPRPASQLAAWKERTGRAYSHITRSVSSVLAHHSQYTPEDFLAAFIQVAPKGSVGEGKALLKGYFPDIVNMNKRLWLDCIPAARLIAVHQTEAIQRIKAQIKTESGFKMRQIYPGDITHWLIESIASHFAEDAVYECTQELQLGNDMWQNLADVRRRLRRWEHRVCTVASDYANFNILHTIADMVTFWTRVITEPTRDYQNETGAWDGKSYRAHIFMLAEWLKESLNRMYILPVVGRRGYVRVVRGLMSGWRTTSFINNTKNHVYSTALNESCKAITGYAPLTFQRKNGDDADSESLDIFHGLMYLRQMAGANLDIQPGKQLLGYDASEFLRIFTYKGHMFGSLNRAIGGFTTSDLQHPIIDAGLDYVKGTSDAMHVLARRGADLAMLEAFRTQILSYYAYVQTRRPDGTQETTYLTNTDALFVPESEGGFGCTRYGRISELRLPSSRKWIKARAQWVLEGAPHFGVQAMYNKIHRRFTEAGLSTEPLKRVHADIVDIAVHGIDTKANQPEDDHARAFHADHIAWLNGQPSPTVHPAPDVLNWQGRNVAHHAFNHIMNCQPDEVTRARVPDPQYEMEHLVGRILGLASVSPGLIHQLYDSKTNRRIPYTEVYERLQTSGPHTGMLHEHWPAAVVDMVNHRDLDWKRETYGTCPVEFKPALLYVQKHVVRACFISTGHADKDVHIVSNLLQATANYFSERVVREISQTHMF
jgi:hypothetical protein